MQIFRRTLKKIIIGGSISSSCTWHKKIRDNLNTIFSSKWKSLCEMDVTESKRCRVKLNMSQKFVNKNF